MSNNAVYNGAPYHLVEVEGHEVELEPVEGGRDQRFRVDVMAPTLIIDPTDDQWPANLGNDTIDMPSWLSMMADHEGCDTD